MTNPAPQFRPRRSRQKDNPRRRWVKWGALTGAAALIVALGAVLIVQLTGGDDGTPGASGTPASSSTSGSADGREPFIDQPPYAFVVQLEDLADPGAYKTSPNETYIITETVLASGPYFPNVSEGEARAKEWGFVEGYLAVLEPRGESADVAQGKPVVRSETYLFETTEGARQAYEHLATFHTGFTGSESVQVNPLGNSSSAFTILEGTVPNTELPLAYHRLIARRGNLVYIAQVSGVHQFTTMDMAREFAVIIDDKATGARPAPTPTPPAGGSGAATAPVLPPTPEPTPTP